MIFDSRFKEYGEISTAIFFWNKVKSEKLDNLQNKFTEKILIDIE